MKRTIAIILAIITVIAILPVTALGGVTNSSGSAVSSITLPTLSTGSESVKQYTVKYTNTDYINAMTGYAGIVIPVKASKAGLMFIDYNIKTLGATASIELYKEASLQTSIDYTSIYADTLKGTIEFDVPKSGTYYMVFYSYSSTYTEAFTNEVSIKPYVISNEDRTLSAGKWSTACSKSDGETYYKITVSKLSVVTVYSNSQNISITLRNSKKKALQKYSTYLDKDNNYRASYALAKGTYYISTKGNYELYKIKYTTSSYATLKAGKYTTFSQACGDLNMYVKFKATASGYVTIKTKDFSGYVTLCNSKIKALSTKQYISSSYGDTAVFGVTKGVTYYLRLNDNSTTTSSIAFTNTKITDQSGSTKAKAKSMAAKKTYKGYIAAGSKTKDWYKFTLTSSKYIAIDVKGGACEKINIDIYKPNGSSVISTSFYGDAKRIYTYNKIKGTYYICVSRGNAKSSGHYSLNLKTSNKFLG